MIRKNRRNNANCLNSDNIGVDLNRNYGYKWGVDNLGSQPNPCEEDYRGEHAFSEPETQSIRDFVDAHPNLKIAINFHAWGNLFVIPFNYSDDKNAYELISKFPGAASFYDDVWVNGGIPTNNVKGSGILTVDYTANGEASDWMLKERGIYAMSPELGNIDRWSEEFFITHTDTIN
jgi:hypothetical protein